VIHQRIQGVGARPTSSLELATIAAAMALLSSSKVKGCLLNTSTFLGQYGWIAIWGGIAAYYLQKGNKQK
jgi:hypothetical protein